MHLPTRYLYGNGRGAGVWCGVMCWVMCARYHISFNSYRGCCVVIQLDINCTVCFFFFVFVPRAVGPIQDPALMWTPLQPPPPRRGYRYRK